ncbi:MAG: hypothetical protein P4L73_20665 [Caulobacteraceae bacterium]|nr:hypothetical protein [Caulobacteraceae bacterium]
MIKSSANDWYLREWLQHFGKRQASMVRELGWTKARASYVWHGRIPYTRDVVNEIAGWLGIEQYELLMRPEDALALRNIRQSARQIAAEDHGTSAPEML